MDCSLMGYNFINMKKLSFLVLLFSLPLFAFAAGVEDLLINTITFLNNVVIPFLFGIAFLFFVINVFRFFIFGGSNPDGQEKAKALAIYSVAAFVFLIVFWGVVNMMVSSIGLGGVDQTAPDYIIEQSLKNPITCPADEVNSCEDIYGYTVCRCKKP